MTACEWIICECTGRWVASLRVAIGRQAAPWADHAIYEVRSFDELAQRLVERPHAVALVEVRSSNLANSLAWLAEASRWYPQARFIGLLDCDGMSREAHRDVIAAVLSAGAVESCDSPRRLQHVLAVGQQHAESRRRTTRGPDDHASFSDWAMSLLPWQPA